MSPPTSSRESHRDQPLTAVVTIIAKNYLAHARVLMDSVKRTDPHCMRVVLLVDQVEGYFDPTNEDFIVVSSEALGIPQSRWFHFKYSVLELSTAVKPFFLSWLIRNYKLQKIIYLDPDIRVYSSLRGIEEALDHADIVLTPHLTEELNDDRQPSELQILRTGTYNLGFIGVRTGPEVDRFLLWWQSRLYDHCVVDLARGFFVDQRWIDLVPGLFSGVRILRDVDYNVAYWNADHRRVIFQNDAILVNDRLLCFFHFSGYDPRSPDVLSRHQDRVVLSSRDDLKTLCDRYRQELFAKKFSATSQWPYTHARFQNGCQIPDIGRHLLSEAPHLLAEINDPFSDEGFERMVDLWNAPISRSGNGSLGVTKLAYRVYRLREDVQAAMPDIFGADHVRFLEWMLSSAPREHLLSEPLLTGVHAALQSARLSEQTSAVAEANLSSGLPVICADLLANGVNDPVLRRIAKKQRVDSAASFNEMAGNGERPSRLTILARYIYESRLDLQRVFPDPQGRDAAAYLAWLLNYGRHSYGLTEEYLAPLRKNLGLMRSELRFSEQARLDIYGALMRVAFRLSPLTATIRNVRKRGISGLNARAKLRPPSAPAQSPPELATLPFGVNVYGYFRAETGVGQSARNGTDALKSVGVPFTMHNLQASLLSEMDRSVAEFSESAHYSANLYFVNADQTAVVHRNSVRLPRRYNIGFWTWELDEMPWGWDKAFEEYDEIWVPSGFCQAAIAARAPIPVIRIPYSISPPVVGKKRRQDFSIDSRRFVFLTVFDMRSCFDRKNPLGVVRAFKAAFSKKNDCELVVKVNHADSAPEKLEWLRSEAAGHSIRLIEETFRHDDVVALIDASDCIVSLHRSEGFGLVLGEAMLLEKPVIATAYSGNLDFTTPNNSFLVSYNLQEVGPGNPPYPPHCLWADPCLKDASEQMQTVYEKRQLREQRARAGRVLIENQFSPAAVGAAMEARLQLIKQRR